eukprot:12904474-Prorocentrum_lima.AAC.1
MKNDLIMKVLVSLAKKRVAPYARTRFNILPDNNQEVAAPRSRSLGAYTIGGCGITKTTFGHEMHEGIHAPARLDD